MKNTKLVGKTLATAAAFAFAAVSASSVFATEAQVKCFGVNSCKGNGACKTSMNACKGQNSCKGKGFEMMSKADCDTKKGTTVEPAAK